VEKNLLSDSDLIGSIFKNSPCKVCVVDTSFHLIFFNEKFKESNPFFPTQDFQLGNDILPKDNTREEWENYFNIVFKGTPIVLEKNYFIEGKEKYDLIRLVPLHDSEKKIIGCILYAEDVLIIKKSEFRTCFIFKCDDNQIKYKT